MPQGGALSGDDVPITEVEAEVEADVQTGTDNVGAVGLNSVTGDGIE